MFDLPDVEVPHIDSHQNYFLFKHFRFLYTTTTIYFCNGGISIIKNSFYVIQKQVCPEKNIVERFVFFLKLNSKSKTLIFSKFNIRRVKRNK